MDFSDCGCSMTTLSVLRIPAFDDNYLWLIHDDAHAVAVDPGDAAPIQHALDQHGLTLTAIVLTHHHSDHVGGVEALVARYRCPVFGSDSGRIAAVDQAVRDQQVITIEHPALSLEVMAVPGHTIDHLAYHCADHGWLFCGDTLFAGGCGRLFEGSPTQMLASLERLAALPGTTQVYCAHEYTLGNLVFAAAAEPDNPAVIQRLNEVREARANNRATVPSTMALERVSNPFLRIDQATIRARVSTVMVRPLTTRADVFAALREWKNNFKSN